MKKAFKNRRLSASAALLLLLTLSLCVPAFAAGDVDKEKKGSISVTLTERSEEQKPVVGAEIILYKAGYIKDGEYNQAYVLTPEFADSGLDLADLKAEGLAEDVAEYALANDIRGTAKETDADGFVLFEGLDTGLYLVMQETPADGYYPVVPFLVSVPMTSQDGTEWIYDVDASPKVELITDKSTSDKPGPQKPPPMIQTGQLRWPVPALAAAGIILFAVGWALTYIKGRKDS